VALAVVPEIVGWTDDLSGITVTDVDPDDVEIVLHADGSTGKAAPDRGMLARHLADIAHRDPSRRTVAHLRRQPTHRALVAVADVPGYGWAPGPDTPPAIAPVHVDGATIANSLVTVQVDSDGTFTLDGCAGLARLVDGGDVGDTYNWCPPEHDTVVEGPESVAVVVRERGPLRAAIDIDAEYRWPQVASADGRRRLGEVPVAVRTTITVYAGEPFVRVEHAFENTCRDHRLRVLFPLPRPAASSYAGCAFATAERGLTAEGGPTETGVPTFPAQSFVRAGDLTIATDGVVEYELVQIEGQAAQALAVTVLRATGWLSRGPMATRPLPAGPVTPLLDAQVPGPHTMRYAVSLRRGADPYALHEDAFVPLQTTPGGGSATLASHGQALCVEGDVVVSSVRRRGGHVELRAFNPHPRPAELRVPGRGGRLVDLRGTDIGPFGGAVVVPPQRIVTVALD
jgi:alpha-mannosidase